MQVKMKRTKTIVAILLMNMILISACGSQRDNQGVTEQGFAVVGLYKRDSMHSAFPVSEIEFFEDGTVKVRFARSFTGTYKEDSGQYEITIKDAETDLGKQELKDIKGLTLTAEQNSDGSLTLYISAKIGHSYVGPESEVFKHDVWYD